MDIFYSAMAYAQCCVGAVCLYFWMIYFADSWADGKISFGDIFNRWLFFFLLNGYFYVLNEIK